MSAEPNVRSMAITSPVAFIWLPSDPVGARELVEREARQLDDDVVERGLEGGDGRAGHDVRDLGQAPPDRDLGRDPGDRVARRLRGERGRPRHARVDLDDGVLGRVGRQRELDVAAALDAERPDDRQGRAPQPLVDRVGQRLDRRDDDRIAGVDAERVDVLHRADGDARVVGVAHDLVLDLLPADEALLDHDLADRAGAQAGADALAIGGLGLDDAAAGAAERERRAGRWPAGRWSRARPSTSSGFSTIHDGRRVRLADPVEQVAERLAVLGHPDRLERRAEEPDRVAVEDARLGHRGRQVERGLAAEAGQQALGLLLGDDGLDGLDGERLEVDDVGHRRVGHDRGRVRVDEDRPDALGAQGAAGLGPGVVELGRLADDDRAGPEDEDRGGLRAGRRQRAAPRLQRRRRDEPVEHGQRVERPGRALRVVLDGLDRLLAVAQPLDRAVVEVDLADPEPGRGRQRRADDLDLVVLGGHLDDPELDVVDRVVRAVVAEPQPGRVGAGRPRRRSGGRGRCRAAAGRRR